MASEKEMSFWDHLDVLRGTLFRSVVAVVAVAVVFLCIRQPLFQAVLWPTQPDFPVYRWLGWPFGMQLINIDVTAQFFVHLKVAALGGVVIAFPYIIYEIWKFIAPALYDHERRAVRSAFGMASVLFYLGVAVGYFVVLPVCLMFFMNYTVSDAVANQISLNSYMGLFVSMVFIIGLVFEFPTVIAILSNLNVINRGHLKRYRKHAVLVVLIVSAFITPSDPVSMFVLAVPLYGLYELSVLVCKPAPPEEVEP